MCVRSDYKHQDNNFVNFGLDISIRHSKLLKKTQKNISNAVTYFYKRGLHATVRKYQVFS